MFEKNCPKSRSIALLGSTGSIGRSTLDVVRAAQGRLPVFALSAHANIPLLREQMDEFRPRQVVVTDHSKKPGDFPDLVETAKKTGADLFFGSEALCRMVAQPEVEVIVSAIVGSAGLQSTLSALEAGKTVALANKESLVVGGELVKKAESKHGGRIIPIDSEHSAIWQCLEAGGGRREAGDMAQSSSLQSPVSRLILTASGGPFRKFSQQELERVTVSDALAHPTWEMGKKITVDSATLINKALEIIEARWFFDLSPDQISVMIHPQSVVHSMVEFVDGAVFAQLSPPDMRLPIQWAIDYPERFPGPAQRVDWSKMMTLEFFPPDFDRFPALRLGLEVATQGGTAGAVFNAANEVAVEAFFQERLPFHKITTVCQTILENHHHERCPTLERLWAADRWARSETEKWISR